MTSISDGSSTNSSRLSQFGIYKSIDARTEEFLRLSRKRQLRQGCACAALSTAITVTIVVTGLLVYQYTTLLDEKSYHERGPDRSHWHGLFNTSSAFKPRITVDPTTLKLLPLILKALNHNRYLETYLKEKDVNKQYPSVTKRTPKQSFHKHLLPSAKMRTNPSAQVKYNLPLVKPSIKYQDFELFRKNKNSKHQENVLKYFNKMIDSNAYKAPLSLTEKENAKLPFFEYPVDIVGKRNSTTIRESKAYVFSDDSKKKTKKQIKKHNNLNKFTGTFKNSTARNTLAKPKMTTIPMSGFTDKQPLPKTVTNKFTGADCVCTMKLLNLLNKLINNIQDIIPELKLIGKRCHEEVTIKTIETKTMVPARLSPKQLTIAPTMPTAISTSKPRTTSTTIAVPTTIPTTVTIPTTISTTVALPNTSIPTTTFLEKYQKKEMKVFHIVETTSKKSTIFGDLLKGTGNAEYINRELLDTEYTSTKSPTEQTYSFTKAPTTDVIKSYTSPRSDPFYYTNSNKIEELLNEFKQKVEQNIMRTEYDHDMEIPTIINANRNIEPLISGVETLNPHTLEGYNRMKKPEEKSETEDVNSFKSILIENTDENQDTKISSSLKKPLNNTQINNATINEYYIIKPEFQKNYSTSPAKLNKFDEVFKSYADVNALISQTQNLSNASIYELYKKKEEDNSTVSDYDEVIEGIEAEQISPLIRRSKPKYYKKTKHNNINTDTVDILSMLPISRSSYLEIHRSVPKQDSHDYDMTDLSNNDDRK